MIQLYHEAPLFAFDKVQELTGGSYSLVHLFNELPEYFDKFVKARQDNINIILDNSIFELEEKFDPDEFKRWIEVLKPNEYIIPDVLEDAEGTVKSVQDWITDLPGTRIGVVQGKTLEELEWCYEEINPFVDKIAISFDYSFYMTLNPSERNHLRDWTLGRRSFLAYLHENEIINEDKPHHLLGCSLPWEFKNYNTMYPWIQSIDTSNPVMWAIEDGKYPKDYYSIIGKPSQKLFTLMDWEPESSEAKDIMLKDIEHNINVFNRIVNG